MPKKSWVSLSFVSVVILMLVMACGGGGGGGSAAELTLSNTNLELNTRVGQSAPGVFSITNTGDDNLNYTVSEDEDFITVIDNAVGTVAPGVIETVTLEATCDVQGTLNGVLTVESNGGNAQVAVALTCTPLAPPTTPNPTPPNPTPPNPTPPNPTPPNPTPPNSTTYDIAFEFIGEGMTQERRAVFDEAAVLWSAVITGDLEDIPVAEGDLPAGANIACQFETPEFVGTIDDLLIFASIAPIDGPGQILGQAGPSFIRANSNDLTIIGCMQFDEADVESLEAQGTFNETILHEMGHVLGYGTLWEPSPPIDISLLDTPCASNPNANSGFNGSSAVIQFGVLGESGNPPVENNYGPGTRCGHWDEGFFDSELMTGFLGGVTSATVNPFSALTIASMEDLGYQVDYSEAEPYSIPACSPNCDNQTLRASSLEQPWEIVLKPRGTISPDGKIALFSDR